MNNNFDPNEYSKVTCEEVYEEEHCGWPGDGSGFDDFEDMNQNEADDYRNEGDDENCECDTPIGEMYGDGFDTEG